MITSIKCYYVHSSETFHTFHRMFYSMPHIIFEYSLDFSRTFPGMFGDIHRNIWRHFPECLATFLGIFGDIARNIWRHSPGYFRTFPGMFGHIPRNITFPYSSRSPHSVPRSCIPGFIDSRFLCAKKEISIEPQVR